MRAPRSRRKTEYRLIHRVHDPCQLELRLRMPWNGYDPRGLTRGSRVISFVRKGMTRPDLGTNAAIQLELFPEERSNA